MPKREVFPGWTPRDVASHYAVPGDLDGGGQTVAIMDLGEVLRLRELQADFTKLGLPMPEVEIIDDGGPPPPALPKGAMETHIDVEVVASLCPAARLRVYRCAFSFTSLASGLQKAVDDDVDVISVSWGAAEGKLGSGDIARIEQALKNAHAAGITVCAASGDFGAAGLADPQTHLPMNDANGTAHCIYPASSAYVLACGGTELIDEDGTRHETVWNNTGRKGRATGGGVSMQFSRPDWQSDMDIASANPGAKAGRIVPDVAALAAVRDWAFAVKHGQTALEGGTSAVAPFFAGLIALANQTRVAQGKKRLGFVNAQLYDLAGRDDLFIDIGSGHNRVGDTGRGYEARTGYDACTGWGVPKADRLISALAALP